MRHKSMRHTFRINVSGKGYTLLTGTSPENLTEFPLDMPSYGITENMLSAQRRIDEVFDVAPRTSRWYLCISYKEERQKPVVSYGSFLDSLQDDRGRAGVSFFHAIEIDDTQEIGTTVKIIISVLSQTSLTKLVQLISEVAQGQSHYQSLARHLIVPFANPDAIHTPYTSPRAYPIQAIEHDCGGATSAAWLAMSISHSHCPPPWEIYDRLSRSGNIETVSTSRDAYKQIPLSNYIYEVVSSNVFQDTITSTDKPHYFPSDKTTVDEPTVDEPTVDEPTFTPHSKHNSIADKPRRYSSFDEPRQVAQPESPPTAAPYQKTPEKPFNQLDRGSFNVVYDRTKEKTDTEKKETITPPVTTKPYPVQPETSQEETFFETLQKNPWLLFLIIVALIIFVLIASLLI